MMRGIGLWLLLILLLAASCKKEAGDGGLATIEGHLYEKHYDPSGGLIEQMPAAAENVYIVYGDNTAYDDRVDTDSDGKYQFKELQKGAYRVFAFSDCNACSSGIEEVGVDVEISDKKGTTEAADILATKNLDYNDGAGSIRGLLVELEYTTVPPIVVSASYNKPNENVYIVYGNDPTYFDRVDTDGSGVFQFTGLLKGTYRLYAFSDCESCPSGTEEKGALATISTNGEAVDLGTITIEKR
jgi:hypothetical protein